MHETLDWGEVPCHVMGMGMAAGENDQVHAMMRWTVVCREGGRSDVRHQYASSLVTFHMPSARRQRTNRAR